MRRRFCARNGGIHVLDRHELILVENMRGARDVAGNKDVVGHHTVDVEGTAAGIAGHPPESSRKFRILEPFDVADRTQRRHHHIDVEGGPVGELGAPDVAVGVPFEGIDCNTGTEVDSGVTLHLGGDIADHPAKRADQRGTGSLCDCHVQSEVTTNGGHF